MAAEKQSRAPIKRRVQPGDKIWLTYSDSERARYIRKHGHGKPWRHAFTVKRVKPHAVLLDVPRDGSVPDVIPWQSLRKCSFAAPHFHDDGMLIPDVNERGMTLTDRDEDQHRSQGPTTGPPPSDPNGWLDWAKDPSQKYEIERIIGAERAGRGWRIHVKWKGYPDPTPETLSDLLKDIKGNQQLLDEIEKCKNDYLLLHPAVRVELEKDEALEAQAPARVQPPRLAKPAQFSVFAVSEDPYTSYATTCGLCHLTKQRTLYNRALNQMMPDHALVA